MIACRQCNTRYADPAPRFCGRCGADLRVAAVPASESGDGRTALALDEIAEPDPFIGRVIAGRYRVLGRIGSGGMGVVYRVEHTAIGKIAALKMLHPMLSTERDLIKRFRTEARAVSLLTHPNTVQVFDFGEEHGSLFMVMELVRGTDLATILDREGPLPWRRAAPLLMQICEALAEAHEAGIVHRDIKPENVLVRRTREGRETVKVLDFGLAKLQERPELADVTGRGTLIGTPYYMAPEQIRGEEPDARSDIYALGALAYRVLTREHAFEGAKPVAVLTAHLTDPLRPMSERRPGLSIDPAVEALVARCLAREPADRFASADEVRKAIERVLDNRAQERSPVPGPIAEGEGPPRAISAQLSREDLDRFEDRLRRRGRWRLSGLLLLLLGAGGLGGYALWRSSGEKPVTEEVEPNDGSPQANLIDNGVAVRGHIGRRLTQDSSDRDYYRFHVTRGPALLRLELSGLPNMDLYLAVYSALSDKVAEADNGRAGDGEVVPNLRLEAGNYYVLVREVRAGAMATENITDWYTLRASWRPPAADEEAEPDDAPAQAMAVPLGQPITGYSSRADDEDYFYPRGEPGGELSGRVSGIDGVDLRLVVLPPGTAPGADPAAAAGARVFDSGGTGSGESFARVPWPPGGAAPIVVVLRNEPRRAADRDHRAAVRGVAEPYALQIDRGAGGGTPEGVPAAPVTKALLAPPPPTSTSNAPPLTTAPADSPVQPAGAPAAPSAPPTVVAPREAPSPPAGGPPAAPTGGEGARPPQPANASSSMSVRPDRPEGEAAAAVPGGKVAPVGTPPAASVPSREPPAAGGGEAPAEGGERGAPGRADAAGGATSAEEAVGGRGESGGAGAPGASDPRAGPSTQGRHASDHDPPAATPAPAADAGG